MKCMFAVAAALGLLLSSNVTFAQTRPAAPKGDKPAPKTTAGNAAAGGAEIKFPTNDDKVSYGIGLEMGGNFKMHLMQLAGPMYDKLKLEAVMWGLRDGLMEDGVSRVGQAELDAAQKDFQTRLEKIVVELAKKNLEQAKSTLAVNKTKPGVKTTKSGLQYKVVKSGKGPTPKPTDIIRVHYHGTLTDGKVFDSSVERKEPAELDSQLLIPGWQEALSMMKVGDKWTLHVPPELAYGEMGRDGIEPNSLLIFDLELLGIVDPDELAPPAGEGAAGTPSKSAAQPSSGGATRKPATPR